MFQIKCLLVCFFSYFILESNAYDASYITPCRAEDEACMKSSAKAVLPYVAAGIPELGVPQADPIVIKNIDSQLNNPKLRFTDVIISGPGKANFLKVTHDTTNRTVKVVLETSVSITGHYDIQGKLLFLPTDANGNFKFYTEKMIITIEGKYKDIEKNGLKYWKITGFDYSYDLVEKVHMKLENIFGGNEEAAKSVNQILDKNWREVTVELGGPIMKQVITEYVNIIKKLILCIPANKLAVL